jgi:hypothetical protein
VGELILTFSSTFFLSEPCGYSPLDSTPTASITFHSSPIATSLQGFLPPHTPPQYHPEDENYSVFQTVRKSSTIDAAYSPKVEAT